MFGYDTFLDWQYCHLHLCKISCQYLYLFNSSARLLRTRKSEFTHFYNVWFCWGKKKLNFVCGMICQLKKRWDCWRRPLVTRLCHKNFFTSGIKKSKLVEKSWRERSSWTTININWWTKRRTNHRFNAQKFSIDN